MIKVVASVFFIVIFIIGCTSSYTSPIASNELSIYSTATPNKTSPIEFDTNNPRSKEEIIYALFKSRVEDDGYDLTSHVLHKYLSDLDIFVNNNNVIFVLYDDPEPIEESYDLAIESLYLTCAMIVSEGWDINNIELVFPNQYNWEYKYVIDRKFNIVVINNDPQKIFDLMKIEISPSIAAKVTQTSMELSSPTTLPTSNIIYPTNTITYPTRTSIPPTSSAPTRTSVPPTASPPQVKECKYYSSGTVNCMIMKTYCSYQSSVNGKPTFCNDAPYPNHSFTYVVWGHDVSYLNGRCILIYGKIEYYNGKPQISWQNLNGFDGYCD